MSQFSHKYYNENYGRLQKDKWIWEVWSRWGLFEYLVIFLLGAILYFVAFASYEKEKTPQYRESQKVAPNITPATVASKVEQTKLHLNDIYYPKKVLPKNPLPSKTLLDGKEAYGPLTIEEYLYFADDTGGDYPAFIDRNSRYGIVEKMPKCAKQECPMTTLSPKSKDAYESWISKQTSQELHLKSTKDGYFLVKN